MNIHRTRWSIMLVLMGISSFLLLLNPGMVATVEAHETQVPATWPGRYFAPYSFDYGHQTNLVSLSQQTNTKFFTLAFIINAMGKTCEASWNGVEPVGSWMQASIRALQSVGGNVSVSFGGAAGKEIADSCTSVSSLEAQYRSVMTAYNLTHLDFDIEGKTLSKTSGNDLRNKAIAALQNQAMNSGQQLVISYTLPVNVTGLTSQGIKLLQNAIQNGVNVGVVNIMTMDYYSKNAPGNQMGRNAIKAAHSTFKQLQALYPSKSAGQIWAMIGLTPMIGMNDDHKEIFTLQDAQTVLSFAEQQNIALLSFWDVQRDHQCYQHQKPPNNCTGVTQQPYQYDQTFAAYTG